MIDLDLSSKWFRKLAAGRLENFYNHESCLCCTRPTRKNAQENMDTAWHKGHVGTKDIKPSGRVETKVAASDCVVALKPAAIELGEPNLGLAHQVTP